MAKKKRHIHLRRGAEIDGLREAGQIAAEVLRLSADLVRPGISTGEIDEAAAEMIADRGCKSAFLGYRGFPGTICISLNEEVVHGIGSRERMMGPDDIVKIDVGIVTPDGWVGDNAKTVPAGELNPKAEALMFATEESLEIAISHARAGNYLSKLSGSVERCAEEYGFTVVREMVGHGVGRDLHEEPQVPNFWERMVMGRGPKLMAGMVLAIEPMINAGVAEIDTLEDDWTVVTRDGELSAHFEHTVLITDDEPEILTPRPRLLSRSEKGMEASTSS